MGSGEDLEKTHPCTGSTVTFFYPFVRRRFASDSDPGFCDRQRVRRRWQEDLFGQDPHHERKSFGLGLRLRRHDL